MSVPTVVVGCCERARATLAASLDGCGEVHVAATADDAASTLLQAERVAAQVVIIANPFNGSLPAVCDALQGLPQQPKVLLMDADADEEVLVHAIESGVDGYLSGVVGAGDADGAVDVAEAVRGAMRGEAVIPPAMLGSLLRRLIQHRRAATHAAERLVDLTPRERQVLMLLSEGLDPAGIAATLVISPETARTHVQRILRKLDVHSRQEAIALVSQTGIAERLARMVDRSAS